MFFQSFLFLSYHKPTTISNFYLSIFVFLFAFLVRKLLENMNISKIRGICTATKAGKD